MLGTVIQSFSLSISLSADWSGTASKEPCDLLNCEGQQICLQDCLCYTSTL
jgi:hypothetical protein